jgi:hypothetical protein
VKGFYLTAVNAGGQVQDAMHSDATQLRDWEKFQRISLGADGRITDVIHTDARRIGNWEKFKLTCGVK